MVESPASGIVRIHLYQSTGSDHSPLFPLPLPTVVVEQLQLPRLMGCWSLSGRGAREKVSSRRPRVFAFLTMQGIVPFSRQKVGNIGVAMIVLAIRQSREIGLVGELDVGGPRGRRAVGCRQSHRQVVFRGASTISTQVHGEILGTVHSSAHAIDALEGSSEVQFLLAAGSGVLLRYDRTLVELDVAHKGGEMNKVLVAARAIDVLLLSMELAAG